MTRAPSGAATVELGGGFIHVRRPDGQAAVFVPHLQSAGVAGMMSPRTVNARNADEVRAWLAAWGFAPSRALAQVDQVHGTDVVPPSASTRQADGLFADGDDVILSVKAADCAPLWFADMSANRFALVHAGWRGVADGIVGAAVTALTASGSSTAELAVAVGPHLQRCCFEVGPEVAERFAGVPGAVVAPDVLTVERARDDSVALNLSAAIAARLHEAGIRDEQTFVATACTRCHPEYFHSYRRNGAGGPLMAAIAARRA
ncbi:MAG: polyphenol oxidase family protein [Candidatus Eremiobacteraeota bacterium]|nr:polyphenol oxidase family protein [Candidatus Eremiobacteraeota bacterium]MBV8204326.1 polyphenol oxidase family protein [Candidatus Eremiobacteraeota bacterium]MBV8263893.1 polyphenol oxidase family protein [Candidatus Eremiobacteraeota bacterium]MBV8596729.1 polyphenol oxidase family protein [Candidatus Eremiobacteraeota bacterium]MBV8671293.1 polyphenol oxidase family protein [Candidatus Eremiobacteraeota bacterium]